MTPTLELAETSSADDTEPVSMSFVEGARYRRCEKILGTPYVVCARIGEGGMGEVYEVEHDALGRRAAVKLLHDHHRGRADVAARLRVEARSLAKLRHPNLVDVFDLGMTLDGRPYFAMELLRGKDLRQVLDERGFVDVGAALGWMIQALDGLAAVHAAGVVHRDVKLENLFLCDDGGVKILDFGVAKVMGDSAVLTQHGRVVGTQRMMAPEQHRRGAIDPRTDVYAAGLVLYELVAGRGPFDELRTNAHALRYAHCERAPLPPSTFAPQPLPEAVDRAVLRAIAKSPDDRFSSASEMAEELRRISGERRRRSGSPPRGSAIETLVSPVSRPPPPPPPPRRAHVLLSILAVLTAVAIGFILGRELPRTEPERPARGALRDR